MKSVEWYVRDGRYFIKFDRAEYEVRDKQTYNEIVTRIGDLLRFWNQKVTALEAHVETLAIPQ